MCGIAGVFDPNLAAGAAPAYAAARMAAALARRGPDAEGVWSDPDCPLAIGHRRLSIIDPSPAGAQPMVSADGRFVISYNGELYNFRALRGQLEHAGRSLNGDSDTEVLLESFSTWGVESTLKRADGMFALALWDIKARTLVLARDRVGEKPLYYGWWQGRFLFASDLSAFAAIEGFAPSVDRHALALYLRHNYVPEPHCIYSGLRKLEPGAWLRVDVGAEDRAMAPRRFWALRDIIENSIGTRVSYSDEQAVDRLDTLLSEVIRGRMVADVPLGAMLSGGIDSSTVVALMQANSAMPIKTFSIGFELEGYDEAGHARDVAAHLGTDHCELYVGADDARAVIPELPDIYAEPFADVSQIPSVLIARLARGAVTVAMTGDAGDEVFAGYLRYAVALNVWQRFGAAPAALRNLAVGGIRAFSPRAWDRLFALLNRLLPGRLRQRTAGDKLHKLARILRTDDPAQMYLALLSIWPDPASVVLGCETISAHAELPDTEWMCDDPVARMMYSDTMHYLPGDILAKVDRAAMSAGLETRVPFLAPDIIDFAWQLPFAQKIRGGQGKWLLRRVLERYVPAALVDRPKMGFAVPIDSWLRGPLRPWAEDLLSENRLRDGGYFDPEPVRSAWRAHLGGAQNLQHQLWGVLMFEAWRDRWRR